MSRAANPIAAAVRSWALRSPARLALGMVIVVAMLLAGRALITAATSTPDTPTDTAESATSATSPVPVPVDEVTETQVAAMSSTSVVSTPARAAMFYAHTFVDTTACPTEWALALTRVTDPTDIDDRLAAARPATPVSILGPTRTTERAGDAGTRVDIDTSAGLLTATLTDTGHGWRIDTPLPTVNLDAPPTPTTSSTPGIVSPTTSSAPSTTTQTPILLSPTPAPPLAPAHPDPIPVPVPVPGPIPLPDLNTPLPGPLT